MPPESRAPAAKRSRRPAVRIYCAGPLFNESERSEMGAIARVLEGAGFTAFLPHRDAFLYADLVRALTRGGYAPQEAGPLVQRAIFCLDCYEVLAACQAMVLNLNGRVPDEGAVAEAAMAWTAGLPVVVYKDDARSHVQGYDNPLVAGLGGFVRVSTLPEVAYAFTQLFKRRWTPPAALPASVRRVVRRGKRLSRALSECRGAADAALAVVHVMREPES